MTYQNRFKAGIKQWGDEQMLEDKSKLCYSPSNLLLFVVTSLLNLEYSRLDRPRRVWDKDDKKINKL